MTHDKVPPMFDSFDTFDIDTGQCVIHGVTGGSGPPLLLLHGYPQTHHIWHKVAPTLAERFTVIAADLRGYGKSSKPASLVDHASYSKRAMAEDMVELMRQLGHERFRLVGHDRGARVAHRLAVDHSRRVSQLVVLDIAPTREMYAGTTGAFARAYWHWYFLIQPSPLPETLINSNPEYYVTHMLGNGKAGMAPFDKAALAQYLAAYRNPDTVRATCEDYRAAASIDIEHDNADGATRLNCPLLVLWGANGVIEACFDPLSLWRERAENVRGRTLQAGHFLAEEVPDRLLSELLTFFDET